MVKKGHLEVTHAAAMSVAGLHGVDLTAVVLDVYLHLVEARHRHGEAQQPVDPDHVAPA